MLSHYLKKLYALDTLDTRFILSAKTPPKLAVGDLQLDPAKPSIGEDEPSGSRRDGIHARAAPGVQPSKWNTTEFYLYYLVFLICVPLMFKQVYDVSQPSHPNYSKFSHLLSDGWIPGRKVDNSDQQYASFRNNVPYLALVVVLHPLLRKLYDSFWRTTTYTQVKSSAGSNGQLTMGLTADAAANARLEQRVTFDLFFALIFCVVLHGFSAFKVFFLLYVNYKLATSLPKEHLPLATWTFNVAILFANELCHGYPFSNFVAPFLPDTTNATGETAPVANWGAWIDSYGGLIPRWEVLFNITVLRLISFNLDYYWSLNLRGSSPLEVGN